VDEVAVDAVEQGHDEGYRRSSGAVQVLRRPGG
jgi:hypothetical protein